MIANRYIKKPNKLRNPMQNMERRREIDIDNVSHVLISFSFVRL